MIYLFSELSEGITSLSFTLTQEPCFFSKLESFNQHSCYHCWPISWDSNEFSNRLPVARFMNTSGGSSKSCFSPSSHLSLFSQERASAGVLSFP
jgi:hypothetical protein